jgi:hypothetical protein
MSRQLVIMAWACVSLIVTSHAHAQAMTGVEGALIGGVTANEKLTLPSCPSGEKPNDSRTFRQGDSTYTALLCWNRQAGLSIQSSLSILAYRNDGQLAAEATVPLEVEGQVKAVKFDGTDYVISSSSPTFPVLVDARL